MRIRGVLHREHARRRRRVRFVARRTAPQSNDADGGLVECSDGGRAAARLSCGLSLADACGLDGPERDLPRPARLWAGGVPAHVSVARIRLVRRRRWHGQGARATPPVNTRSRSCIGSTAETPARTRTATSSVTTSTSARARCFHRRPELQHPRRQRQWDRVLLHADPRSAPAARRDGGHVMRRALGDRVHRPARLHRGAHAGVAVTRASAFTPTVTFRAPPPTTRTASSRIET